MLRQLIEEMTARNGPLQLKDGKVIDSRTGVRVEILGALRLDENARACEVIRRDLVDRGLLVSHSTELSNGRHYHAVTAGEYAGSGHSEVRAFVAAWLEAARGEGWGDGEELRSLKLERENARLREELKHLRIKHNYFVNLVSRTPERQLRKVIRFYREE